jgi:nucleoside-diphosphate-sugar epimerase
LLPSAGAPASGDDGPPIHPLPPSKITMFAAQARFKTEKAAQLLGYRPAFSLDRGMAITEEWAKWARIA